MTQILQNGLRLHREKDLNCIPNYLIEEGYLDLHLWVTYKCSNNCPHCYLRAMKNKTEDMNIEKLVLLLNSIKNYKKEWKMLRVTMYGAEPQSLSPAFYHSIMDTIDTFFPNVEYGMYTSLQVMDSGWIDLFKRMDKKSSLAMLAISYDGGMRGKEYGCKLKENLRTMNDKGLMVGAMSVVNKQMVSNGASAYVDFLEEFKMTRFSLKPFIPIEGQLDTWKKYAANMAEFSNYAIAVHEEWEKRGLNPSILSSTLSHACNNNTASQNTGGFTLFVDGGLRSLYMGYRNKVEYLQEWGKIKNKESFKEIVNNPVRKSFLADQRLLHSRSDCMICPHAGRCLAEVFKDSYDNSGECIGAKKFIDWALDRYDVYYEHGC